MPNVEVHEAEEWSALYVDGKLELVGDHYLADERIRQIFGVETVQDDAFMRGGNTRSDVAKNLDEIEAYKIDRDAARVTAEALRAQAAELEEQAKKMDTLYR